MKPMSFVLYPVLMCSLMSFCKVAQADTDIATDTPLTLEQATKHALENSPRLAAIIHQADADKARLKGYEGFPNPEISLEVEDFLGSGVAHGADSMQVTTSLTQGIPLASKTGALRGVNRARHTFTNLERQITEQAVRADVAISFLNVLAYQRRLETAVEMEELARKTVETIKIQVDAGRASGMEADKAAIVLSLAGLDRHRLEKDLLVARHELAAACGENAPFFQMVTGTIDRIDSMPVLDEMLQRLDTHPVLLAGAAQVREQQARLKLEKAARAPDLSVSLGYRWMNATRDSAIVAGISVPLPIIDYRQGSVDAASYETQRAISQQDQEHVQLVKALTQAYQALAVERERAIVLKEQVYPNVVSTFGTVTEGYRLGRFGYLDLLDAQRTLFEVKEMALEALVSYQRTAIILQQTAAIEITVSRFDADIDGQGDL